MKIAVLGAGNAGTAVREFVFLILRTYHLKPPCTMAAVAGNATATPTRNRNELENHLRRLVGHCLCHVRARHRQVNVTVMGTTEDVGDRKWNNGEVINTLHKFTDEEKGYDLHYDLQLKR